MEERPNMLEVKDLHASIEGKEILKGVNLTIRPGEIHAIMGPNGSGKSTLSAVLTGNPSFTVTGGEAIFEGKDLLSLSPEDRSHEGVFLSFQYPVEIPGVSTVNFMRAAVNEKRKYYNQEPLSASEFLKLMREKRAVVELDNKLASRSVNEGFSGGEKKRNEIFQMAMLDPKLSILDETDSGLDIDALRIVASGVNKLRTENNATIVITHYQRLLDYIKPDFVHANIVPWQLLQRSKRIILRVVPMNSKGEVNMDIFEDMFTDNTRFVAISHVSNVLGTINPVKEMISIAHRHGVPVLVDGAQAVSHLKVDVRDLDADFYAFSSHKMYGPAGVGVLYGKRRLLEAMPPYQGGGEMISHVSFEKTTFAELPFKFEAGTPDFVDIAAFSKAIDYIKSVGIENIAAHENELLKAATEGLMGIPGMRIFGTSDKKSAVISFLVNDISSYDMGLLLDKLGIAVRTGHHCAQPLMTALGVEGTVRASFAVYNTLDEVKDFVAAVERVTKMF